MRNVSHARCGVQSVLSTNHHPCTDLAYQGLDTSDMTTYTDVSFFPRNAKPLSSYRKYWASRFGVAPFLPMSREEMSQLG
jgi:hypothetical protein